MRELVLDAGMRLFAARGFAGTSLREISEATGVSVSLIQYHFGTKEALYDTVRALAFASYTESQRPQFELPIDAFELFMGQGLRQYFCFFEQNPTWRRFAQWAALEGDTRPYPGEDALMERLVDRVKGAQRAGRIRADVDPELLLIVVGGMMNAWLGYRERYAARLTHLGSRERAEDAYLELCVQLLLHASSEGCERQQPKKSRRPRSKS